MSEFSSSESRATPRNGGVEGRVEKLLLDYLADSSAKIIRSLSIDVDRSKKTEYNLILMMNALTILNENSDFVMGAYNMSALMGGMFFILILDTALKGWAMWRAAKMEKKSWFIMLLITNSAGILPIIFLFMTKPEYVKRFPKGNVSLSLS
ncbi:MAG TPA: DUF5652 family protein [Candidatus Peribacterales bacterium]|nr:DUF5652 family protein [Candidatus Peribacterales bacterium]